MKHEPAEPPISFTEFLKTVGVTACTGWRWRQKKLIETVNILGRQYVSRDEIRRFNDRAAKGEFAREQTIKRSPGRRRKCAA